MGVFGKVANAKNNKPNAAKMDRYGSFYAKVEKTKYVKSKKGDFGVVECTVIQPHDEAYKQGEFLADMCGENFEGQIAGWMAPYVAAANDVPVGHKFSEVESENEDKWDELSQEIFGSPEMVDGEVVFTHDDVLKGTVGHWKIVEDRQSGKKNPKKDDDGNVIVYKKVIFLGFVGPDEIDPAVLDKYKNELHEDYV